MWNKWKTFSVIFKTLSRKWLVFLAEQRGVSAPQPRNATKLLPNEIQKFNDAELRTDLNFRYLQGRKAGEIGPTLFLFSAESV